MPILRKRTIILFSLLMMEYASAILAVATQHNKPLLHFTLNEFTRSDTAQRLHIDNTPEPHHIANLTRLIIRTLDPARQRLAMPIYVNSGYRCPELNKAIGGAENSYHMQGRAADVTTRDTEGNRRLYLILKNLPHTELIWEQNGLWIHIAL